MSVYVPKSHLSQTTKYTQNTKKFKVSQSLGHLILLASSCTQTENIDNGSLNMIQTHNINVTYN